MQRESNFDARLRRYGHRGRVDWVTVGGEKSTTPRKVRSGTEGVFRPVRTAPQHIISIQSLSHYLHTPPPHSSGLGLRQAVHGSITCRIPHRVVLAHLSRLWCLDTAGSSWFHSPAITFVYRRIRWVCVRHLPLEIPLPPFSDIPPSRRVSVILATPCCASVSSLTTKTRMADGLQGVSTHLLINVLAYRLLSCLRQLTIPNIKPSPNFCTFAQKYAFCDQNWIYVFLSNVNC